MSPTAEELVREALRPLQSGGEEARLRWLIEWSGRDLSRGPEEDWIAGWVQVIYLVSEWWRVGRIIPWPFPHPLPTLEWPAVPAPYNVHEEMLRPLDRRRRRQLARLQSTLRAHLGQLAAGEQIEISLRGTWKFHLRRVPDEPVTLDHHFHGTITARLLLLATRILERVGPWKLMACPYKRAESAPPCDRLFLAKRGQKFCSLKHSRAAAWNKWLQKHHGGTRAKNVPANVPATIPEGPGSASRQPTMKRKTPR